MIIFVPDPFSAVLELPIVQAYGHNLFDFLLNIVIHHLRWFRVGDLVRKRVGFVG
jgi:hypothetical protein